MTRGNLAGMLTIVTSIAPIGVRVTAQDLTPRATLSGSGTRFVYCVAFSPDGKSLAFGGSDYSKNAYNLALWDVASRTEKFILRANQMPEIFAVTFSPDGKKLASGGQDGIRLWDAATGKQLIFLSLKGVDGDMPVAFSPDSQMVASRGDNGSIKFWDAVTGKERVTLNGHADRVVDLAFSPDGKTFVSADIAQAIKIWDVASQKQKASVRLPASNSNLRAFIPVANSIAFSPDGKTFATGGGDTTARIWDVATGKVRAEFRESEEQSHWVRSVSFSADGKTLLVSNGYVIMLWDVVNGKGRVGIETKRPPFSRATFSPDGKMVATGGDKPRLWDTQDAGGPMK
jgi:WD40 repeat protein